MACPWSRFLTRIMTLLAAASALWTGTANDGGDIVPGWREYWNSKLVDAQPPPSLFALASPLALPRDIEASFICIMHGSYSLCLCAGIEVSVCATAMLPAIAPPASTCVFHFFYEYHKTCGPPVRGPPHAISSGRVALPENSSSSAPAFFTSRYLFDSFNCAIPLPPLDPFLENPVFLPRSLSAMIPFSTSRLPEALELLHVPPESAMARSMQETLDFCESEAPTDEESLRCVTSIESMVDFVSQNLGTHVAVLTSTIVLPPANLSTMAKIQKIQAMSDGSRDRISTCHNLLYPYLVYGCHVTTSSSVLSISFEDVLGEALVICHGNTTTWNPQHPAFEQLQTSPGNGDEVCHWIPQHHFVWLPSR
ncbi:hypothetical protein KP509_17G074900 [Ceratopteris richardii]|uniref:BURP domain-containing protein n=1 Tax=Ceratopteris richardii TaxID=49495 RepID=A0A8T2SY72_CERRI|nr:hypothetical protein KP509_17G074900 [Ceratopteris richardii]